MPGDFDDDNPTRVDIAAPEPTPPDEDPTVARCLCGARCQDLGPIFPDAGALAASTPFTCARGAGGNGSWSWCALTWVLVCRVRR